MARPTNERKDRTIRIRISEEMYNALGRENVSVKIRGMIRRCLEDEREAYHQEIMDKAVEKEIKQKCSRNDITTHDFYRAINDMWNEGEIYIEYGDVRTKGKWDMVEFEHACNHVNAYPQTIIDKFVKGLRS